MHSKRHRKQRQRLAAFRFVNRNGRRKQPIYKIGHWSQRRAWHWYVDLCIAIRRYSDQEERQT